MTGARLARLPGAPYLALLAAVALIGLVPQYLSRTLPDIAFLLYAAGRVLDGATLYVDLVEINPPLIVWLNLPIVAAARELGISEITAYRVAVTLLLIGSVAASARILRSIAHDRPTVRPSDPPTARPPDRRTARPPDRPTVRLSVLLVVVALFVLPRLDWGEREHLTLALVLPYVLLGAGRLTQLSPRSEATRAMIPGASRAVADIPDVSTPVASLRGDRGAWFVMLIALAAGIGIALKPQFVILWAAREGIVYWRTRRITPEGLVIPVVGAIYLAAVVLFTPEYFEVVRELGPAYHRFIRNPILVTALLGDGAALALGALIVSLALRRWVAAPRLVLALAVAVLACYLAAVFQQKGWRYHFYPALALGWILLSVIAISLRRPLVRWTERLFAGIAGAAALTVALAAAAGALVQAADPLHPRYDADPSVGRLIPWLREHAAGEPVMVLSPNMASGFPLTTYAGTRWVQRYSNLWPAVAAYADAIERPEPLALRPAAEAGPLEVRLREAVTAELIAARPPYVLVLRTGPDEPKWGMRRLDLVEFLRVDPRFAAEFAAYDSAGAIGQYVVHRRADAPPLAPVPRDPPPESRHAAAPDEMRLDPGALPAAALFLALLGYLYRASRRGGMNLSISEPG